MGLYSGGLIIGRIFVSVIWGAYFWEGLFFGGLIIGILWHIILACCGHTKLVEHFTSSEEAMGSI